MESVIEVKNLHKAFGSHEVLKGIDFAANKGEVTCIIGSSGSGKSTLLRCINLLEMPDAGEILYHGENILTGGVNMPRYHARVGMVFQQFNLFGNMNVLHNCMTGQMKVLGRTKQESEANALKYLKKVGMDAYVDAKPRQLSGGQKQRVAIARALAMNPKVLLCDEATSALDPNTTRQILDLLKKINQELGVTIVVITHEMKVIETICNRVAVLDQSHVVEEGMVRDVFIHPTSRIARQLIMPAQENPTALSDSNCLRIVFDGYAAYEPVISNLALECRAAVNILFANTRVVDGKTIGQMLLQLPQDETTVLRVKQWLTDRNINFKEETLNVYGTND